MLRFLPIFVALLLALALSGCLWLMIPEAAYEGYEYHKGEGTLYSATHPARHRAHHHSASTATPEIE